MKLASLGVITVAAGQTCSSSSSWDVDIDYHNGQGLGHADASSADDCCTKCSQFDGCSYFTFVEGVCWFKSNNAGKRSYSGATSGGIAPAPPAPPTPPPPPPGKVDKLEKEYAALQSDACGKVLSHAPVLPTEDANKFMKAYQNFAPVGGNWSDETVVLDLASQLLSRSDVDQFLTLEDSFESGGLDSFMVKCAVLEQSTSLGLAQFAAQGQDEEDVVTRLLNNIVLMRDMLVAGGAKDGKFGQAMGIYENVVKASQALGDQSLTQSSTPWDDRSQEKVLSRFALATALEHAVPLQHRFETTFIDPVQRYLHYEHAYLAGDLDPAFEVLTVFECRGVANTRALNDELEWMRTTLPNYRPDHMVKSDYHWRFAQAVHTDVAYGDSVWPGGVRAYKDIPAAGGECGARAWFGRFARQSFGMPDWGIQQPGHAAMTTWSPDGWATLLGGGWDISYWETRGGEDYVLETQSREFRSDFQKVLRGQWLGMALGEEPIDWGWTSHDGSHFGKGGLWSALSLYLKKLTVQEQGKAPTRTIAESVVETKIEKLIKRWPQEQPAPSITTDEHGTMRIPAAAVSKKSSGVSVMTSGDAGQQLLHQGGDLVHIDKTAFEYEVMVEEESTYFLTANITTWHVNIDLLFSTNASSDFSEQASVPVYWTNGYWNETQPLEVKLVKGKNILHFDRIADKPLVIKEFFLFKTKPIIPAPDPGQVPAPTPPPTPFSDYIELSKGKTCASQGIVPLEEKDCSIASDYLGYKYTGSRARDFFSGCFCLVTGEYKGNCNFNTNASADQPNDDARALCLRHQYIESSVLLI